MNEIIEKIDLTFPKEWEFIDFLRQYFKLLLISNYENSHEVDRVMIAVNELLENYLKNSISKFITLSLFLYASKITFEISNTYSDENVAELQNVFENIDYNSVSNSYVMAISTKLKDSIFLGIARIIGECSGQIEYNTSIKDGLTNLKMILTMNINS